MVVRSLGLSPVALRAPSDGLGLMGRGPKRFSARRWDVHVASAFPLKHHFRGGAGLGVHRVLIHEESALKGRLPKVS